MTNLKDKSISAFIWVFIEKFLSKFFGFFISLLLARLLDPQDFGLIAMIGVFIGLAEPLMHFGFGPAIIQRQDLKQEDYSTIFYINIFTGLFFTILFFLISPFISSFYNLPELEILIKFYSLSFFLESLNLIQRIKLKKNLNFKALTKIRLTIQLISAPFGITLAFNGFGVWSLVIYFLLSKIIGTTLFWLYSTWIPSFVFNFNSVKKIFKYSANIFGTNILNNIVKKFDVLLIGKFFSPSDIAFYTRAQIIHHFPVANISGIFKEIFFPILSTIQNDKIKLRKNYLKIMEMISFINFPMMLGLYIISDTLIYVLLTEKWMPVVPYLKLYCFIGLSYPLSAMTLNILLIANKSDIFLKLEIIKKIIYICGIFFGLKWGIMGILIAKVITDIFGFFINLYFSGKEIQVTLFDHMKLFSKYIFSAIFMSMIVSYFGQFIFDEYIKLIFMIFFGIIFYTILSIFLNLGALLEIKKIILNRLKTN